MFRNQIIDSQTRYSMFKYSKINLHIQIWTSDSIEMSDNETIMCMFHEKSVERARAYEIQINKL